MTAATRTPAALMARPRALLDSVTRNHAWTLGLIGFLALLFVFTRIIQPTYGVAGVQGLAVSVLPLALAAVGQAIVVIARGIDLSIGSMIALTSVVSASLMQGTFHGSMTRRRSCERSTPTASRMVVRGMAPKSFGSYS
jgi:ribose/xylose/arabinose/galactoside ABC-type transport system permease subunit